MLQEKDAFFLVEKGEPHQKGEIIIIDKESLLLGRAWEDNRPDITFTSPYVSRKHLRVEFQEGSYFITDLSSRHGTKINNNLIKHNTPRKIRHGDRIVLAKNEVQLLFCRGIEPGETLNFETPGTTGEILFQEEARTLIVDGRPVELTGNLYELFHLLYQNKGKAVSHQVIKQAVWPERECDVRGIPLVGDEEIAALVKRLREKLGGHQERVLNIRGYGYIWK